MTTSTKATSLQANEQLSDFEMLQLVAHTVEHNALGIFATIGLNGQPRVRWMIAGVGDHGLSRIYTLTGRHARKLLEIAHNPSVSWVFTSPKHADVITITGKVTVLEMISGMDVAWIPLMQATAKYHMSALANTQETAFVALETEVEKIEIISPRLGIYAPRVVPFYHPINDSIPSLEDSSAQSPILKPCTSNYEKTHHPELY